MNIFLTALLECSAAMSVISLVFMGVRHFLSKRYSANWLYYVWIVIAIGWVIPFRPRLSKVLFPFQIPKWQIKQIENVDIAQSATAISGGMHAISSINLSWLIASIWVICSVCIIIYHLWRHKQFLKMIKRWSEDITDFQALDSLNNLKMEMKIKADVRLKYCPCIASPMMVGFFHPVILLPSDKISANEMVLILRHELIHLKRNDLWSKVLILLAVSIHWFNPVIYIVAKAIAMQCEISCDELLVKETDFQQRKQYGEVLIGAVRKGNKFTTALSTNFYRQRSFIRTRILSIMDATKKKAGMTILCAVFIVIMGSGMTFASGSSKAVQVINVNIKNLAGDSAVAVGGPYILEEGDSVHYRITAEGISGKLVFRFFHEDNKASDTKSPIKEWIQIKQRINRFECQGKVTKPQAGSYCLYVCSEGIGDISNIRGTIEIRKKGE